MPGELTRVIRRDQPFGPPDSRQIQGLELQAKLFDWHNHAFAELLKGSHLIIGRRGSGKSALIRSYRTRTHLDHNLHSPAGRLDSAGPGGRAAAAQP